MGTLVLVVILERRRRKHLHTYVYPDTPRAHVNARLLISPCHDQFIWVGSLMIHERTPTWPRMKSVRTQQTSDTDDAA